MLLALSKEGRVLFRDFLNKKKARDGSGEGIRKVY